MFSFWSIYAQFGQSHIFLGTVRLEFLWVLLVLVLWINLHGDLRNILLMVIRFLGFGHYASYFGFGILYILLYILFWCFGLNGYIWMIQEIKLHCFCLRMLNLYRYACFGFGLQYIYVYCVLVQFGTLWLILDYCSY